MRSSILESGRGKMYTLYVKREHFTIKSSEFPGHGTFGMGTSKAFIWSIRVGLTGPIGYSLRVGE